MRRAAVKWHMTDDEIRRSWKRAEDRRAQIGILAELNNRSKDDVRAKLIELGEEVPEIRGRGKCKLTADDDRKIWRYRNDGLPYYKIAAMLGGNLTDQAIKNRVDRMREMFRASLPTVKQALKEWEKAHPEESDETKTIKEFIRRFL